MPLKLQKILALKPRPGETKEAAMRREGFVGFSPEL